MYVLLLRANNFHASLRGEETHEEEADSLQELVTLCNNIA